MVFVSSLFTGMGVLVSRSPARATGTRPTARSTRRSSPTVMSFGVLAPLGYLLAPRLLSLVNATPAVQAEALPFLRIMFVFSFGMMTFFMLGGALRAAGDAKTPLRRGVALTVLNIAFNLVLILGLGPIPAFGTAGAAMGPRWPAGSCDPRGGTAAAGRWVVGIPARDVATGMGHHPGALPVRPAGGIQGVAMNIGGVLLLRFIGSLAQSAEAQAAFAIGYTELFSMITWTSVGLMGATGAVVGQNLGAGQPDRATRRQSRRASASASPRSWRLLPRHPR